MVIRRMRMQCVPGPFPSSPQKKGLGTRLVCFKIDVYVWFWFCTLLQFRVKLRDKWNVKPPFVPIGGRKSSLRFPERTKFECSHPYCCVFGSSFYYCCLVVVWNSFCIWELHPVPINGNAEDTGSIQWWWSRPRCKFSPRTYCGRGWWCYCYICVNVHRYYTSDTSDVENLPNCIEYRM